MQVGMDIGKVNDGYRRIVGDTRRIQVDNDFGNESEGYNVTVVGYSGDAGRY